MTTLPPKPKLDQPWEYAGQTCSVVGLPSYGVVEILCPGGWYVRVSYPWSPR